MSTDRLTDAAETILTATRAERDAAAAAWMDELADGVAIAGEFASTVNDDGPTLDDEWFSSVGTNWQHLAKIAIGFASAYPAEVRQQADAALGAVLRIAEPLARGEVGQLADALGRDGHGDRVKALLEAAKHEQALRAAADNLRAYDARHGAPPPPQWWTGEGEHTAAQLAELADDAQHVEPVEEVGKPAKPAGYTQAELLDELDEAGVQCKISTFRRIRIAAEIEPFPNGKHGSRYGNIELRKLIQAAKSGGFRDGKDIAAAWKELLDD